MIRDLNQAIAGSQNSAHGDPTSIDYQHGKAFRENLDASFASVKIGFGTETPVYSRSDCPLCALLGIALLLSATVLICAAGALFGAYMDAKDTKLQELRAANAQAEKEFAARFTRLSKPFNRSDLLKIEDAPKIYFGCSKSFFGSYRYMAFIFDFKYSPYDMGRTPNRIKFKLSHWKKKLEIEPANDGIEIKEGLGLIFIDNEKELQILQNTDSLNQIEYIAYSYDPNRKGSAKEEFGAPKKFHKDTVDNMRKCNI